MKMKDKIYVAIGIKGKRRIDVFKSVGEFLMGCAVIIGIIAFIVVGLGL